jgi:hypothetical protein
MHQLKSRIIFTVLTLFTYSSIFGQNSVEEKISGYFDKYCSEQQKAEKLNIFTGIFKKLPPKAHEEGIKAIELVLPQVCMLNFPSWLIDRTFNLAIYGIHEKKITESTIEYLTEMIPFVSIGKIDYNEYGLLMEKMLWAGIPKELVFDMFRTGLDANFSRTGIEALAFYYTTELKDKKDHKEALSAAIKLAVNAQKFGDRYIMMSYLFNDDPEKKIQVRKKTEEEARELEKQWEKFWKSHKNKIHFSEKFEKVKVDLTDQQIVERLKSKAGTPYGYRGNRNSAIDITGMISFLTGQNIEALPYIYDTYCTGGSKSASTKHLNPGDLIFFKASHQGNDTEVVGIFLESSEFILITHKNGVEILNLEDEFYTKKFIKACRILK